MSTQDNFAESWTNCVEVTLELSEIASALLSDGLMMSLRFVEHSREKKEKYADYVHRMKLEFIAKAGLNESKASRMVSAIRCSRDGKNGLLLIAFGVGEAMAALPKWVKDLKTFGGKKLEGELLGLMLVYKLAGANSPGFFTPLMHVKSSYAEDKKKNGAIFLEGYCPIITVRETFLGLEIFINLRYQSFRLSERGEQVVSLKEMAKPIEDGLGLSIPLSMVGVTKLDARTQSRHFPPGFHTKIKFSPRSRIFAIASAVLKVSSMLTESLKKHIDGPPPVRVGSMKAVSKPLFSQGLLFSEENLSIYKPSLAMDTVLPSFETLCEGFDLSIRRMSEWDGRSAAILLTKSSVPETRDALDETDDWVDDQLDLFGDESLINESAPEREWKEADFYNLAAQSLLSPLDDLAEVDEYTKIRLERFRADQRNFVPTQGLFVGHILLKGTGEDASVGNGSISKGSDDGELGHILKKCVNELRLKSIVRRGLLRWQDHNVEAGLSFSVSMAKTRNVDLSIGKAKLTTVCTGDFQFLEDGGLGFDMSKYFRLSQGVDILYESDGLRALLGRLGSMNNLSEQDALSDLSSSKSWFCDPQHQRGIRVCINCEETPKLLTNASLSLDEHLSRTSKNPESLSRAQSENLIPYVFFDVNGQAKTFSPFLFRKGEREFVLSTSKFAPNVSGKSLLLQELRPLKGSGAVSEKLPTLFKVYCLGLVPEMISISQIGKLTVYEKLMQEFAML